MMRNISHTELLAKARQYSQKGHTWHHHYLPPRCALNNTAKHLIILEASGDRWQTIFAKRPLGYLEKLENLFFKR